MRMQCGSIKELESFLKHHLHLMGMQYTLDESLVTEWTPVKWVGLRRRRSNDGISAIASPSPQHNEPVFGFKHCSNVFGKEFDCSSVSIQKGRHSFFFVIEWVVYK